MTRLLRRRHQDAIWTRWARCLKDTEHHFLDAGRLSPEDAKYLLQQARSTRSDRRPRSASINVANLGPPGGSGGAVVDQMIEFFSRCPLEELVIEFGETADDAALGLVDQLRKIPTLERLKLRGHLEEVNILETVLLRLQLTSRPGLSQLKELVVEDFFFDQHPLNAQILVEFLNGHSQLETLQLDFCFELDNGTESRVVDAIVAHPSLQKVTLPFNTIQVDAASPLIRHFAEGNSELTWLDLNLLKMKKLDDDGGNNNRSKTQFTIAWWDPEDLEWSDEDTHWMASVLGLVSELRNVTQLRVEDCDPPNLGGLVGEVFCSQVCSISDLEIEDYLYPTDAEQLWLGLHDYTKLTRLSLKVQRFPPAALCPLSTLQEVDLSSGASALEMISFAAALLSQQRHLQKLSFCLGEFQGDGSVGEHVDTFQKALQRHPSLHTLHVRYYPRSKQHELSEFLRCTFGAVECNPTIKTLALHMWLLPETVADCLLVCLPRLKHVKKLLLRRHGFRFGVDRGPTAENAAFLHQVLKQNTCICLLASTDGSAVPAYVQNHAGIRKVLRRNSLLDRVKSVMDNLPTMSAGLWVNLVAKLGSNDAEPTPLYVLCKSTAAIISSLKT